MTMHLGPSKGLDARLAIETKDGDALSIPATACW